MGLPYPPFRPDLPMDQEGEGRPQQDDGPHQGDLPEIPHHHGAQYLAAQLEFQPQSHPLGQPEPHRRAAAQAVGHTPQPCRQYHRHPHRLKSADAQRRDLFQQLHPLPVGDWAKPGSPIRARRKFSFPHPKIYTV